LFAVGSHGRGLLGWKSDLDVLFVTSGSASEIEPLVDAVLYPLWDAGVTIGHQVMVVDDLLQNAHEALQTATALLDIRLLAGSESLSRALQERAFDELFTGTSLTAFLERMQREVEERWRRFGDSVYLLEPDVKNGAGGLRDADVVRWTARAAGRSERAIAACCPRAQRADARAGDRPSRALRAASRAFYGAAGTSLRRPGVKTVPEA
jgi:[protein-PII] uridylyltransferase